MNFRSISIGLFLLVQLQSVWSQDLASLASNLFSNRSHTFTTIKKYSDDVGAKVESLLDEGVTVFSDWDDTLNQSPGAWWQKNHNGTWFCEKTKRFRLEHEVDDKLRDLDSLSLVQKLRSKGIPFMVTTARPPVSDTTLDEIARQYNIHPSLMDVRKKDNPDLIDFDQIHHGVYKTLTSLSRTELAQFTREKIQKMSFLSGINIRGQELSKDEHVFITDEHHVYTYSDGFAFIGHNKGPGMLKLIPHLSIPKGHLVIVDDSARALGSYLQEDVIQAFENHGYTLHLLHYPVPSH